MTPLFGRHPHRRMFAASLILASVATSALVGATLTASPALAQFAGGVPGGGGLRQPGQQSGAQPSSPSVPEPAAVPGARARTPVAPATRAISDMSPTDALFDAINRGDIAAARDALSRGADLDGVNVLGMTPMELSVDLGRNDISFLLLSMRGEDSGRGSRAVAHADAAPAPPPARITRRSAPVRAQHATTVADSTPSSPPKLFANDGGAPLPSAGFLGFGSR